MTEATINELVFWAGSAACLVILAWVYARQPRIAEAEAAHTSTDSNPTGNTEDGA